MASSRRRRPTRGAALRERLEWDRPLKFRKGARERLCGIDLYFDFEWRDHFPDRRAQFRGGQDLASLVIRESPDGKRPALLLTDRDDVQGSRQTDQDHVLVINLDRYVGSAYDPGTASAYLASLLGGGITRAKRFSDLSEEEAGDAVRRLEEHLDEAALVRWAQDSEERLSLLRRIGSDGSTDADDESNGLERLLSALEALDTIGGDVADAVAAFAAAGDGEGRLELLWALTDDDQGRDTASRVLGARVEERLGDARAAADAFDALLRTAGETEIQRFLEEHPWLLGLDYARIRARQTIVRGAVDFLLERFDGFHDLLELKSPNDHLFDVTGEKDEVHSASAFRLSKPLSLALAQVHAYRDVLRHEVTHEELYGLPGTRDPRITILIGRASELSVQESRVLHELNCSLHRVEIVPFDVLARRARAVLDSVDRYLLAVDEQVAEDGAS